MGEALPPSIAALVQRRIQASGQDIRMVDQMRMDQPKTPPKVLGKKQARSPSEEVEEISHPSITPRPQITHADMRHVNQLLKPQPRLKKH